MLKIVLMTIAAWTAVSFFSTWLWGLALGRLGD
jgi:hypothetical protein